MLLAPDITYYYSSTYSSRYERYSEEQYSDLLTALKVNFFLRKAAMASSPVTRWVATLEISTFLLSAPEILISENIHVAEMFYLIWVC